MRKSRRGMGSREREQRRGGGGREKNSGKKFRDHVASVPRAVIHFSTSACAPSVEDKEKSEGIVVQRPVCVRRARVSENTDYK